MMDILLKERLVGAVVLVLAAVIFIPVVLDGPDSSAKVTRNVALPAPDDDDERRTVRIDLLESDSGLETGPAVSEKEPASIDLTARTEPADAAPGNATPAADPAPVAEQSADTPAPAAEPAGDTEETAGIQPWTVQAGSFSNDANAETLAAGLRALGYPAYVSRFDDGKSVHHRVRIGGFASRDAAQAKADEIRARTGQPARPARNR